MILNLPLPTVDVDRLNFNITGENPTNRIIEDHPVKYDLTKYCEGAGSNQSDDLTISCKPSAAVLYNPYFKCPEELRPPNFIVNGLPPIISFLGSEDPSVTVESLKAFHKDLKNAGNVSEFYVGQGGKHGFCVGVKEQNRYFYWSLELVDAFLVENGVLSGENLVIRPEGGKPLQAEEFEVYR